MKHKFSSLILLCSLIAGAAVVFAQTAEQKPMTYRIYNNAGQQITLDDLAKAMDAADTIFVGESHNDPVAHLAELQILQAAFQRYGAARSSAIARPVVLSMEMFERDVQPVLNEYLGGLIEEKDLLASSRPWNNYSDDYKPLVEFARTNSLPVVAANAPERYVRRVARLGRGSLDQLSAASKGFVAPLSYSTASTAYAAKFNEFMKGMGAHGVGSPANMLEAQVLRDATMGYSISEALRARPRTLVVHVTGSFHCEGGMGTPEQLRAFTPSTRSLVVAVVASGTEFKPEAAEIKKLGDFVVLREAGTSKTF